MKTVHVMAAAILGGLAYGLAKQYGFIDPTFAGVSAMLTYHFVTLWDRTK